MIFIFFKEFYVHFSKTQNYVFFLSKIYDIIFVTFFKYYTDLTVFKAKLSLGDDPVKTWKWFPLSPPLYPSLFPGFWFRHSRLDFVSAFWKARFLMLPNRTMIYAYSKFYIEKFYKSTLLSSNQDLKFSVWQLWF